MADVIPSAVERAARSVCRLQHGDKAPFTGVCITKNFLLTAGHEIQNEAAAEHLLAIFNLISGVSVELREVFTLNPREIESWYPKYAGKTPDLSTLNDPTLLEYCVCRANKNIRGAKLGNEPRQASLIAAPPISTAADQRVYVVSLMEMGQLQQTLSGTISQVGDYFFTYTAISAGKVSVGPGDSGSPVFDADGNLIGIHVDKTGSTPIACRADKIWALLPNAVHGDK